MDGRCGEIGPRGGDLGCTARLLFRRRYAGIRSVTMRKPLVSQNINDLASRCLAVTLSPGVPGGHTQKVVLPSPFTSTLDGWMYTDCVLCNGR